MAKVNRKHVLQFIEDFRRIPTTNTTEESGASLIRDLTVTAVKSARHPLSLREVHNTIVSQQVCNFEIRWEFFLASICTKMNETGIVIAGGKVHIL